MGEQNTNSLLIALDLKSTENIISIKENKLADANFIISHLMRKFLIEENSKVCLVILHNTLGHYQNIAKKLGYDLLLKIKSSKAIVIEPLKMIFDEKGITPIQIAPILFKDIQQLNCTHLIFDDVSHLLDLGVDIKNVLVFLNCCINLSVDNCTVVVNCHVSNANDEIVSNHLRYAADVNIEVSALKSGKSNDVTGIIGITRKNVEEMLQNPNVFHYKAYDREIQVFAPGHSLYRLYK